MVVCFINFCPLVEERWTALLVPMRSHNLIRIRVRDAYFLTFFVATKRPSCSMSVGSLELIKFDYSNKSLAQDKKSKNQKTKKASRNFFF